ncbi:diguanylate cyclase domain-containing protein [Magnetospirillum fulvum]|uniref:PAS domain S-box-containing protein/diguanylate cyclase (GGDEF) domain-containing protein n=1 Tax=Magnetospirillum fulvum TaxID=1082 RepID=A0A1H6IAL3_MAGFU|nr:diguanylate cyclase [Magnetospirillum fulvum]SEH44806.1 PAS domain S-box-containing protein/diguanylate cyclase (GGDEF) domain-containing protein [Magnetospirillum fulvum]
MSVATQAEIYVIVITNILLLGMMLALSSGRRDGVLLWAMAFFWHAATFFILLLWPSNLPELGMLAATLTYSVGLACLAQGLGRFLAQVVSGWVLWLPCALILVTAPFIDEWPLLRVVWRGTILSAQTSFLLYFLVRHRHSASGVGKYYLAVGFGILIFFQIVRTVYAAISGLSGWPLLSLDMVQFFAQIEPRKLLSLSLVITLPSLIGISSLFIIKDRLRQDVEDIRIFMQKVLDAIPHQLCVIDTAGEITRINRAWSIFAAENGGRPDSIGLGANYLRVTLGANDPVGKGIQEVLDHRRDHFSAEYPCHTSRRQRWFLLQAAPLDDRRGRAVISHTEISAQKELERLQQQSLIMFRDVANLVPGILYKVRERGVGEGKPVFEFMSPRIGELGLDAQAICENADLLLSRVHPDDLREMVGSVERCSAAQIAWHMQLRLRHRDGAYRWYQGRATPERENNGSETVWYGYFQDIDEIKSSEESIRVLAHHDALTGLPNRILFNDRLIQAMAQARRNQHKLAVLFIDLDRFKPVNDRYGHDMGDSLLRKVAERLRGCLRDIDTPARIGGDEFVVLLNQVKDEADARTVADKAAAAMAEPFLVNETILTISSSIGISVFPDHGESVTELLTHADREMYRRKGRN